MECLAEGAGPVLAHLSLLRPESAAESWKHALLHQRWAADPSSHARKPPRRVRVHRILGRLLVGDCMDAARILCYDVMFLGGFRKEDSVGIP